MTDEAAGTPPPAPAQTGGAQSPPSPGAAPPAAGPTGYPDPPPPGTTGFTSRYGLVRPHDGRYLAGVCAAIGRATGTDPVLWRVVLAVLGFFGGIGVLVYVAAWLIIPGEGDTASPVESMLGRGRSSMSPVTVIVLSILVAVSFGFIVTDAFRAVLLGAAILIGGALLLNRDGRAAGLPPGAPTNGPPGVPSVPVVPPRVPEAVRGPVTPPQSPGPVPPVDSAPPAPPTDYPVLVPPVSSPAPVSSGPPVAGPQAPGPLPPTMHPLPPTVGPVPPPGPLRGYRPPFAPYGPYATAPPVPKPPVAPKIRPPKMPRERSPLGTATFSMIFVALGVVILADLVGLVDADPSTYFAAALATIGAGLLVGTWFGRARWLITLGLVASAALGIATLTESYDRVRVNGGDVIWAPTAHSELAERYENNVGDAMLDLRAVTFPAEVTQVTVAVSFGRITVVVPPNVDVTTVADVNVGEATVFGRQMSGVDIRQGERTDLGQDGPGGGTLLLRVHVNVGELEVTR